LGDVALCILLPYDHFVLPGCGFGIPRIDAPIVARQLGLDRRLRPSDGGYKMNAFYLIAGLIALALLVCLILALLKPEWFG
jgi:hypothetical protein